MRRSAGRGNCSLGGALVGVGAAEQLDGARRWPRGRRLAAVPILPAAVARSRGTTSSATSPSTSSSPSTWTSPARGPAVWGQSEPGLSRELSVDSIHSIHCHGVALFMAGQQYGPTRRRLAALQPPSPRLRSKRLAPADRAMLPAAQPRALGRPAAYLQGGLVPLLHQFLL